MRHASPRHHAKHAVRMRDAGLKRVSVATRVLVAGAVGATGLFSALAAWAQPGRAKVGATSTTAPQATPGGSLSLGRAPATTTPATAPAADDGYGDDDGGGGGATNVAPPVALSPPVTMPAPDYQYTSPPVVSNPS